MATNALIERGGARTAFLTTSGFRDTLAMAHENRFEQYDIFMERPEPLVPRHLCFGIPERIAADGEELLPLDEDALKETLPGILIGLPDKGGELLKMIGNCSVTLRLQKCGE